MGRLRGKKSNHNLKNKQKRNVMNALRHFSKSQKAVHLQSRDRPRSLGFKAEWVLVSKGA